MGNLMRLMPTSQDSIAVQFDTTSSSFVDVTDTNETLPNRQPDGISWVAISILAAPDVNTTYTTGIEMEHEISNTNGSTVNPLIYTETDTNDTLVIWKSQRGFYVKANGGVLQLRVKTENTAACRTYAVSFWGIYTIG